MQNLSNDTEIKVERKFYILILVNLWILFNKFPARRIVKILQVFLVCADGDAHIRREICGNEIKYFYSKKVCDRKLGIRKILEDREISREEFFELVKQRDYRCQILMKTRYEFDYKDQIFHLDLFKEEIKNPKFNSRKPETKENRKYLVSRNQAIISVQIDPTEFVELPRELSDVIEITNDVSMTAKSLAKALKVS